MKEIQKVENRISNINFGARTLYPMNLKKALGNGNYKFLKANFAELSTNSKTDAQCIEDLREAWKSLDHKNNYISDIVNGFTSEMSFFVKECKYFITRLAAKDKPLSQRVATITEVKPNGTTLKINFLQSVPKNPKYKDVLKVKGGGELTMLGIIKYAKEQGFKKIELVSTNNPFYAHMGLTKIIPADIIPRDEDDITHFLYRHRFDDFIKRTEEKYHITNK